MAAAFFAAETSPRRLVLASSCDADKRVCSGARADAGSCEQYAFFIR
jgi:hypothetical protein